MASLRPEFRECINFHVTSISTVTQHMCTVVWIYIVLHDQKRNTGHDKKTVKVQGRKLIICKCADQLESHSSYISQSSTIQTCSDIVPHVLSPEIHGT